MTRTPTASDFAALGLRPGAGDDEIRDAYRRLAKAHHPDRNPGDPEALATFRRLTESYAALRGRARPGSATSRSPLPGGAARRTRRRTRPAAATTLVDLPAGGSAWVAADAVLVGPDRSVALRPSAQGGAFPTVENVIRVERRGDGHHVFMPPQPPARWPVSETAETEGLAVAGLWVGDRQDDATDQAGPVRMPLRLMGGTLGEMAVGDRGWVSAEALVVDEQGGWSLVVAEPVGHAPHRATPVRVVRDADGFCVYSELPPEAWAPAGAGVGSELAPVVSAVLGPRADVAPGS